MGSCSLDHGHLLEHPTEDRGRPQVKLFGCRPPEEHVHKAEGQRLYPLMLVDSEPKEECYHSLNWVKAGKAN